MELAKAFWSRADGEDPSLTRKQASAVSVLRGRGQPPGLVASVFERDPPRAEIGQSHSMRHSRCRTLEILFFH
jgi:hypothetical protein